ncbi:MAG: hypothetical protein KF753_17370 [Caldilineaceae bacterium]|nr:hypothetical protein [Caldilineaceae bacterium]
MVSIRSTHRGSGDRREGFCQRAAQRGGTGDSSQNRDDLFIAFHGSWNRSEPTGYKVVRLAFENGQPAAQVEDFITGWLQADGSASGRRRRALHQR